MGPHRRAPAPLEVALVRLGLLGLALLLWFDPSCAPAARGWRALLQWAAPGLELDSSGADSDSASAVRLLFAAGLSALLAATFWLANGALLLAGRAGLLERWRIAVSQPPPPAELLRECVADALLGQLAVRPLLLFAAYPAFASAGMRAEAAALPSCRELLLQIFVCMQVDDALFYWIHRALHHYPQLYKRIHKQHHRFGHTVGLAVEYAHPAEDMLNAFATMAGPFLLGCHMAVVWLYPTLKLAQSIDAHSGYDLPFPLSIWSAVDVMDCAPAHSFHHSRNTGMYGGYFVFWDRLCGTDASYRTHLLQGQSTGGKGQRSSED
jgi:sterol desaturase/sphingolipid hydroxylase (fatty acid hydroxylase superfamily)